MIRNIDILIEIQNRIHKFRILDDVIAVIAKLKRKDDTGAYTFIVPKKQMTISIREPISEELREIRRKSGLFQIGKGIIAEPKQNVKRNGKNNP